MLLLPRPLRPAGAAFAHCELGRPERHAKSRPPIFPLRAATTCATVLRRADGARPDRCHPKGPFPTELAATFLRRCRLAVLQCRSRVSWLGQAPALLFPTWAACSSSSAALFCPPRRDVLSWQRRLLDVLAWHMITSHPELGRPGAPTRSPPSFTRAAARYHRRTTAPCYNFIAALDGARQILVRPLDLGGRRQQENVRPPVFQSQPRDASRQPC